MKVKVNPTRMELLKLKKRLTLAKRGHKLLKDKEEQLLVEFRKLIGTVREKRKKLEEEIVQFYMECISLKGIFESKAWEEIIMNPFIETEISSKVERIFNIPVKKISVNFKKDFIPSEHPFFVLLIKKAKDLLIKLTEITTLENQLYSFSEEIERTRRRVNALEYVLIPQIEEAIKFINFKLEENERASLTRLKHIQLTKEIF
ncbi:MAG TPA: V-type ATP synthase subunit D [bacterium]|nr:V-type ATP synthase subunit D [bacterium]